MQEKINKQSELNQLTEYDIEMNQLQYELLMARIKLEESQNAKDVVRLTRDENGNYAYRYTANQDKIDEIKDSVNKIILASKNDDDKLDKRLLKIETRLSTQEEIQKENRKDFNTKLTIVSVIFIVLTFYFNFIHHL